MRIYNLNTRITKGLGTAVLSFVFLASGAFIFTSDALPTYGREVGLEAMKQRAMLDISFMICICSGVGILLLNTKLFNNGN